VNNVVKSMWKEAVFSWFETLSLNLHVGSEEDDENFVNRSPSEDLNPRPPENEASVLKTTVPSIEIRMFRICK
jgi:hypothetical protein